MISMGYLTIMLLFMVAEWSSFTDARHTRKCTKKAYDKYLNDRENNLSFIDEASEVLIDEFKGCFFDGFTNKASQSECVHACKKHYQRCHNEASGYSKVLQFSCKLGLSECVEKCHPSASKGPSKNCKGICTGDFNKCFFDHSASTIKMKMICAEAKRKCNLLPSCYRNEKCETASSC